MYGGNYSKTSLSDNQGTIDMNKMIKKLSSFLWLRFIIVGGINTIIGIVVMLFLYQILHCGYWWSYSDWIHNRKRYQLDIKSFFYIS